MEPASVTILELDATMVTDAMRFHTGLQDAEVQRRQSLTATTPSWAPPSRQPPPRGLASGRVELLDSYYGKSGSLLGSR